jgi:hypothetical protein
MPSRMPKTFTAMAFEGITFEAFERVNVIRIVMTQSVFISPRYGVGPIVRGPEVLEEAKHEGRRAAARAKPGLPHGHPHRVVAKQRPQRLVSLSAMPWYQSYVICRHIAWCVHQHAPTQALHRRAEKAYSSHSQEVKVKREKCVRAYFGRLDFLQSVANLSQVCVSWCMGSTRLRTESSACEPQTCHFQSCLEVFVTGSYLGATHIHHAATVCEKPPM